MSYLKNKTVSNAQQKTQQSKKVKKSIVERIEHLLNHKIVTIILLAIISFVFLINYSAIFDKKLNMNGDNIIYYSCGKSIAEGKGYTNVMYLKESPHTHFPPGYSLFIAGLQKLSPDDILFVKKANGLLLGLSLLLLFFLTKKITRNTLVAFCTALFCGIQSSLLAFSTMMMSEMLYIFTTLSVVLLGIYIKENNFIKKGRCLNLIVLVLFLVNLVYIYFVRSVGLAMIFSLGLWFVLLTLQTFFRYRKAKHSASEKVETDATELPVIKTWLLQRIIICLLIAVSFFTAYSLWSARQAKAGQIGSDYKRDFYRKPLGETMSTWEDWKTRIIHNVSGDITKWIPNVIFGTPYSNDAKITTGQWAKGILMVLVLIAGFFYLKRQTFWLLFIYMGCSMVIVTLFPEQYRGPRYLIPIIPFFIFLFFNGIANIISLVCCLFREKIHALILQAVVLFCICAFWLYPSYIQAQHELRATAKIKSWEKTKDQKMNNFLAACKFCKEELPDSIRVVNRKPEIFYMFSGYKKSISFPWYVEPDTVISFLNRNSITHVILDDWFRHAYTTLFPAVQKYPEKFKVLQQIGKVDTATRQNPTYVLEFNDEWGYHGELIDGKKTGTGYEFFQDGRKYVGNFDNNLFHGEGTFYNADGSVIFKGNWRNGVPVK